MTLKREYALYKVSKKEGSRLIGCGSLAKGEKIVAELFDVNTCRKKIGEKELT